MMTVVHGLREEVRGLGNHNMDLIRLKDHLADVKERALKEKTDLKQVISRQRLEITNLNKRMHHTRAVSEYYGHISAENTKQMDRFIEMGLKYESKPPTPYLDKEFNSLEKGRQVREAMALNRVPIVQRLEFLAPEAVKR